ncbi:hypothetical protein RJT34_21775 [Clitoria ternatea]|uniref:Uncharacterized protein n=1 Tax=Clitoria ternatea TaxID=43366 RepID=A0AAN9IUX4_CLITE
MRAIYEDSRLRMLFTLELIGGLAMKLTIASGGLFLPSHQRLIQCWSKSSLLMANPLRWMATEENLTDDPIPILIPIHEGHTDLVPHHVDFLLHRAWPEGKPFFVEKGGTSGSSQQHDDILVDDDGEGKDEDDDEVEDMEDEP